MTSSNEDWEAAQADLYHHLGQQLKKLRSNGTAKADHPEPAQELNHWCAEHRAKFKAKPAPWGVP